MNNSNMDKKGFIHPLDLKAKRCLFERPSSPKIEDSAYLKHCEHLLNLQIKRWNFDFKNCEPIEDGDYKWMRCDDIVLSGPTDTLHQPLDTNSTKGDFIDQNFSNVKQSIPKISSTEIIFNSTEDSHESPNTSESKPNLRSSKRIIQKKQLSQNSKITNYFRKRKSTCNFLEASKRLK